MESKYRRGRYKYKAKIKEYTGEEREEMQGKKKKLIDFNQPGPSEVDKLKTPASRRTTAGSNKSDRVYGILRHFF